MKRRMVAFILFVLVLGGCTRIDEQVQGQPRLVTAIEASFDSGSIRLHRQYTDNDKMRAVLTYLRCLNVYGSAVEEEIPSSNSAVITISYSDGTTKTYEQRDSQYLRLNAGPWQYINPEQGQELPMLLGLMESDEIS